MFTSELQAKNFFDFISNQELQTSQIDKKLVHKLSEEQVVIGDINELSSESINKYFPEGNYISMYYGKAYPNLECNVCFDHPLDHYPLMMIFEMGRQAGIAVSHKFYDVPLTGYINIVDSLSFNFKQFMELDKPVFIVCSDTDVKNKKGIQRRYMEFSFMQEGVYCASGIANVSVFGKNLYKKLRSNSRKKIDPSFSSRGNIIPTNTEILLEQSNVVAM